MKINYLSCLILCFCGTGFVLECLTAVEHNNTNFTCEYLDLSRALEESDEQLASIVVLYQLVREREAVQLFDDSYVQALYRVAGGFYLINNIKTAIFLHEKARNYDKNLPVIRQENGCFIIEKFPKLILEQPQCKECFIQMILKSGLSESMEDIKFTEDRITIKIKSGCCCHQPYVPCID